MKRNHLVLLLTALLLLHVGSTVAQRHKAKVRKNTVKKTVELTPEQQRFEEMLGATQQIVVFDSLLTRTANMMEHVVVNPEEGRIISYNRFFHTQDQPRGIVFVNELGNKCIYSMADAEGHMRLYTSDLLGDDWSTPELLKGLQDEGMTDMNYPYLMPDGQTLYFAARGGEGLGGYDIYRTRLDAESGLYLKPENIGLPFNSEGDDFLYLTSEQDSVGLFISNRRQHGDTLCIYAFIPSESRQVYNIETVGEQQLSRLARLERISDTWDNKQARRSAQRRLDNLMAKTGSKQTNVGSQETTFCFVIDDDRTYTRMSDFKNEDNHARMSELLSMQQQAATLTSTLEMVRDYYAKATDKERDRLHSELTDSEQQLELLARQIRQLEKIIRNQEINN